MKPLYDGIQKQYFQEMVELQKEIIDVLLDIKSILLVKSSAPTSELTKQYDRTDSTEQKS